MSGISIRPAVQIDVEDIVSMLSHLADEIGSKKRFLSTTEAIIKYGFGEKPNLGLSLFFPVFSTNRGKPGVYLQDLWISQNARGQGLGRRMIRQVVKHSATHWDASYLTLTVYSDNTKAMEFYRNLCFDTDEHDVPLALDGEAFAQMGGSL
jgi:ribosomal protein S18 acetylase RimI-like enzyme